MCLLETGSESEALGLADSVKLERSREQTTAKPAAACLLETDEERETKLLASVIGNKNLPRSPSLSSAPKRPCWSAFRGEKAHLACPVCVLLGVGWGCPWCRKQVASGFSTRLVTATSAPDVASCSDGVCLSLACCLFSTSPGPPA